MSDKEASDVPEYAEIYAPGAFDRNDGRVVPVTFGGIGGPVIGQANVTVTAHGLSTVMTVSDEMLAANAGLREAITATLDGTAFSFGTAPVPRPDPGPHPAYIALLDAARTAGEVWVDLVVLHEPHADVYPTTVYWHCEGEQPSGYEWEWPDWPCETVAILARHLGVEVSDAVPD